MKEAVPLEVAEYAVHHNITSHHVFVWWVPQALKHKEKIIKQVSYKLAKKQYKFGIYVPNSVDKVLSFDKENNNSVWHGAIQKEFKNVLVAFCLLEDEDQLRILAQKRFHIILFLT